MVEHKIKKALIPAAGKGIRAYPKSKYIPKALLEVNAMPLMENTILMLRDQMKIKDIIVIVGHLSDKIRGYFGDGRRWQVNITYVDCPEPEAGLAKGMLLAEGLLQEPFACVLGDEYYAKTNHFGISSIPDDTFCICGVKESTDVKAIRKNYSVKIKGDLISEIVEKPSEIRQRNLGCGTYILRPEIFDWIRKTKPSLRSHHVEFMEAIDLAIQNGRPVKPFFLDGIYFNINTIEDVNQCNYFMRSLDFEKNKISLVIPAHNEEEVISNVINDFRPYVDEILVVNNRSSDATSEVSREAGARVEEVSLQGYGDTIKYGLDNAKGDILIVVEADYSFRSKDLGKFLEYIKDADMVIGTRTTRQLIEQGANMNGWLRLGNLVVAKIIEGFWWTSGVSRFTDVGCTYRAIWKNVYRKIKDDLVSTGPEFSVEMMIKLLKHKKRIIEIPISYYPRLEGVSKHSGSWLGIAKTALRMLFIIFKERLSR